METRVRKGEVYNLGHWDTMDVIPEGMKNHVVNASLILKASTLLD